MVPLERQGRLVGLETARTQLGRLIGQLGPDDPIFLSKRGRVVAVLVAPADYEELVAGRRDAALERLRELVPKLRESVAAAGLDDSVVDEAIEAARSAEWREAR